jgi:chloramphenicol O-acetyltransferase
MNLIVIILLYLSIALLVTLFIGIVKKNKRLWITSLIFFIVISLAEIAYFTFTVENNYLSVLNKPDPQRTI